jgi:hypothetical protein
VVAAAAAAAPAAPARPRVVATFSLAQSGADTLALTRGDELEVLDTSEGDWWRVRRLADGAEGMVPSNYVSPA